MATPAFALGNRLRTVLDRTGWESDVTDEQIGHVGAAAWSQEQGPAWRRVVAQEIEEVFTHPLGLRTVFARLLNLTGRQLTSVRITVDDLAAWAERLCSFLLVSNEVLQDLQRSFYRTHGHGVHPATRLFVLVELALLYVHRALSDGDGRDRSRSPRTRGGALELEDEAPPLRPVWRQQ